MGCIMNTMWRQVAERDLPRGLQGNTASPALARAMAAFKRRATFIGMISSLALSQGSKTYCATGPATLNEGLSP